jgi:hypothetical protein
VFDMSGSPSVGSPRHKILYATGTLNILRTSRKTDVASLRCEES